MSEQVRFTFVFTARTWVWRRSLPKQAAAGTGVVPADQSYVNLLRFHISQSILAGAARTGSGTVRSIGRSAAVFFKFTTCDALSRLAARHTCKPDASSGLVLSYYL